MRSLAFATAFVVTLGGVACASPAMTNVPTTMRNAPNSQAGVVQTIPANAEIDVSGCGRIWCSASWRDMPGFIRASAISASPGEPPLVNSDYPPPPPGAAVVIAPPLIVAPFGCCWGGGYYYHRRW